MKISTRTALNVTLAALVLTGQMPAVTNTTDATHTTHTTSTPPHAQEKHAPAKHLQTKHERLPATQQGGQHLSPSDFQREGAISEVMFALHDGDLELAAQLIERQHLSMADFEKINLVEVVPEPDLEPYKRDKETDAKKPKMVFNAVARLMMNGKWDAVRFLIEKGISNEAFDVALRAMAQACNPRGLYGAMILMPLTGRRPNELGEDLRKLAQGTKPTKETLTNKKWLADMRNLLVKDASKRVIREQTSESDFLLQQAVDVHNIAQDSYDREVSRAKACENTKDLATVDFSNLNVESIEAFMPRATETEKKSLSKLVRKIARMQDRRTADRQTLDHRAQNQRAVDRAAQQ